MAALNTQKHPSFLEQISRILNRTQFRLIHKFWQDTEVDCPTIDYLRERAERLLMAVASGHVKEASGFGFRATLTPDGQTLILSFELQRVKGA